jgi:tetratricopeptide (TPR) repeat protein
MKKLILLFLSSLLITTSLTAQEVKSELRIPEEEDILRQTLSTSSPYYYTNLMMKYRLGTEDMSDLEYYYLYYGYVYQENYRPFATNKALDEMFNIMSSLNPSSPTVGQLEALIEQGIASMELDPFNPKVLNIMAYAYGALGDSQREVQYYNHLNGILRAIESSGTGLKEESPWHILMFSHAYDVVASKGYAYNESKIISRSVEYIPLMKKSHDKIKGYYFDYSRIYKNKPEDYTFKRDTTWQFNNLKPREYK